MIAVRALYRGSKIEFLEPPPALAQAPVIVIISGSRGWTDVLTPYAEQMAAINSRRAEDDEDREAAWLLLHEEPPPYRTETNQTAEQEMED